MRKVLLEGRASDAAFSASPSLALRYLADNVHALVFIVRCGDHGALRERSREREFESLRV